MAAQRGVECRTPSAHPLLQRAQVPRASAGIEVVLAIASTISPGPGSQQPSFQAHLADDPAAPRPLPFGPPWQAAVAEIAASVGAAPAGAPPAVIVVAGSKKVGKSTFCRQLANALLNTHPVVAFLDTGAALWLRLWLWLLLRM